MNSELSYLFRATFKRVPNRNIQTENGQNIQTEENQNIQVDEDRTNNSSNNG